MNTKPLKVNKEAFSHNVSLIRTLTGLTMHDFGLRIGANKDQVNTYERGKATPAWPVIAKIAELAGVQEELLINRKLTREQIVKEMIVAVTDTNVATTGEKESLAALQKTVESLQRVIETQSKTIENLTRMLDSFSKESAA